MGETYPFRCISSLCDNRDSNVINQEVPVQKNIAHYGWKFSVGECLLDSNIWKSHNAHSVLIQSWVYSGVALIPFQVYSRSGVDGFCSTPRSTTARVYSTPGVELKGNKCYSGVDPRLISTASKLSIFNKISA